MVTTTGDSTTETFWFPTHRSFFVFDVQAAYDAIISIHNGTSMEYEIIIGAENNRKTIIRRINGQENVAEADTPNVLSPTMLRRFWVDNSGEEIRVGSGNLYENILVETLIPNMIMRGLSVRSRGVMALWSIRTQDGAYSLQSFT